MTTVEAIADLKLVINDPQGPVQIGTDMVYEIQVLNRGSKKPPMSRSWPSSPKALNRQRPPATDRRSFPDK